MKDYKTYTNEELEQIPTEELKTGILDLQDEYQRLTEEIDRLQGELKKNAPFIYVMQSCPKLRQKIERNAKCPCGSGLKYKKCCIKYESENLSMEEAINRLKELGFWDRDKREGERI